MKRLGVMLLFIGGFGGADFALAEGQCNRESGLQMSEPEDAPWSLQIQLTPKDIPLNVPFDAIISVCSSSEPLPIRIKIDANMPAHKHGMNYAPKTVQIDSHLYEAKNLLFHMPGTWRLEVTAYDGTTQHRFTHNVTLQ